MADDDNLIDVFVHEAEELLELAERALHNFNDSQDNQSVINDLFRCFHTIKGSAGLVGLQQVVDFTHLLESLLNLARHGNVHSSAEFINLMTRCRDHLFDLIEQVHSHNSSRHDFLQTIGQDLQIELRLALDEYEANANSKSSRKKVPQVLPSNKELQKNVKNSYWHISVRFSSDAFIQGVDPVATIRYLNTIGEVVSRTFINNTIPVWDHLNPLHCYLGYELLLDATTDQHALEEAFVLHKDYCSAHILEPRASLQAYLNLLDGHDDLRTSNKTILENMSVLDTVEMHTLLLELETNNAAALESSALEPHSPATLHTPDSGSPNQSDTSPIREQPKARASTIRVSSSKLNDLVNLVGELVIGTANAELMAKGMESPKLSETMDNLTRLVGEVRDTSLGLRMVQIGDTFNRFGKIVRESSRELGKKIDLQLMGGETELDKTVVDKISDPLLHLVRNAIDHGIESPEERLSAGKPETGLLQLNAFHESGTIVIQIIDDGAGLNRQRIRSKAIERGILSPSSQLNDSEIDRLIFTPGFSTADTLTNLSGRGVGMDVVKQNIEHLRGQIAIQTTPGHGTTFTVQLPLTLAIIDGFQVRVGDAKYIIPLDVVEECIAFDRCNRPMEQLSHYLDLRDRILPYIRLRELFMHNESNLQQENVVIVNFAGNRAGLVVDEILGEHQTVLKPLGQVFSNLTSISSATILGSGEVAMVIDVAGVLNVARSRTEITLQ